IAEATRRAGRQIIVDSSGAPLKAVLAAGGYFLQPSFSALRGVFWGPPDIRGGQIDACPALVAKKHAQGAGLPLPAPPPPRLPRAGREEPRRGGGADARRAWPSWRRAIACCARARCRLNRRAWSAPATAFLGAMIWALSSGRALNEAFRYGVAAGSAALLVPG